MQILRAALPVLPQAMLLVHIGARLGQADPCQDNLTPGYLWKRHAPARQLLQLLLRLQGYTAVEDIIAGCLLITRGIFRAPTVGSGHAG
jgi:hypothetical protein